MHFYIIIEWWLLLEKATKCYETLSNPSTNINSNYWFQHFTPFAINRLVTNHLSKNISTSWIFLTFGVISIGWFPLSRDILTALDGFCVLPIVLLVSIDAFGWFLEYILFKTRFIITLFMSYEQTKLWNYQKRY